MEFLKVSRKVLVFGVFDMLHPGHLYFLNNAISYGDELHICLASDEYVVNFKNKLPKNDFDTRAKAIKENFPLVFIHQGDKQIREWSIFNNLIPDLVVLGHDQDLLKKELLKITSLKNVEFVYVPAFLPETYSTTNLNK